MTARRRPPAHARRRTIIVMTMLLAAGCSGSGDDTTVDSVEAQRDAGAAATDGELFTQRNGGADDVVVTGPPAGPEGGDGGEGDQTIAISEEVLDPIETVPDTGVPGIDSPDDFCRSWSEFAGSYAALTFAWSFRPADEAALLETVASGAVLDAANGLAVHLPAELDGERQALTVELTGPITRRAERAQTAMLAQGVSEVDAAALGVAWLDALATAGLDADDLAVDVPPSQRPAVDAAATEVAAALPPIVEDPSLIVDVRIPATEDFLAENCPDQGTLAGNDVVQP